MQMKADKGWPNLRKGFSPAKQTYLYRNKYDMKGCVTMEKKSLSELKEVLYSGVVADILDSMGVRRNSLEYGLRPLDNDYKVLGRAFTVLAADVYEIPEEPYKLELESVDKVGPDEVIVASTNGSTSSGFWGELLTTRSMQNGCVGAVIDGYTRDAKRILDLKFPLFVRGHCPLDSKGRTDVIAYQVPIEIRGIPVNPGDYIFGDIDGVVVIPAAIADEVFEKCLEKIEGEN